MPDAKALVDYGVRVEELGYDSLWVWDHMLLGVEPNFPIVDSLTDPDGDRGAHQHGSSSAPASWCCRCAIRCCWPSSSRAWTSSPRAA